MDREYFNVGGTESDQESSSSSVVLESEPSMSLTSLDSETFSQLHDPPVLESEPSMSLTSLDSETFSQLHDPPALKRTKGGILSMADYGPPPLPLYDFLLENESEPKEVGAEALHGRVFDVQAVPESPGLAVHYSNISKSISFKGHDDIPYHYHASAEGATSTQDRNITITQSSTAPMVPEDPSPSSSMQNQEKFSLREKLLQRPPQCHIRTIAIVHAGPGGYGDIPPDSRQRKPYPRRSHPGFRPSKEDFEEILSCPLEDNPFYYQLPRLSEMQEELRKKQKHGSFCEALFGCCMPSVPSAPKARSAGRPNRSRGGRFNAI